MRGYVSAFYVAIFYLLRTHPLTLLSAAANYFPRRHSAPHDFSAAATNQPFKPTPHSSSLSKD
jgi:hypothetical protein